MRADVSMRSRLRVRRLQVSALTTFDTSGRGGWGGLKKPRSARAAGYSTEGVIAGISGK